MAIENPPTDTPKRGATVGKRKLRKAKKPTSKVEDPGLAPLPGSRGKVDSVLWEVRRGGALPCDHSGQ